MENLLGISIVAGLVLSMFIIMIIRMVYVNAKELNYLRGTLTSITAEDAWQQALLLEDKVVTLEMLLKAFKESTNESVDNLILKDLEFNERIKNLDAQLGLHVERISADIHVEDVEMYDWIAERDAEFANSCKVSYRYDANGKLLPKYGDIYIGE